MVLLFVFLPSFPFFSLCLPLFNSVEHIWVGYTQSEYNASVEDIWTYIYIYPLSCCCTHAPNILCQPDPHRSFVVWTEEMRPSPSETSLSRRKLNKGRLRQWRWTELKMQLGNSVQSGCPTFVCCPFVCIYVTTRVSQLCVSWELYLMKLIHTQKEQIGQGSAGGSNSCVAYWIKEWRCTAIA